MPIVALIGASVSGNLMNSIGRRKAIMTLDIIMIIGSLASAIPFTISFGIGRFICGIAAGMGMTIPPSFVNEISPDEMMPKVGPSVQVSANIGIILSYSIGLPLPTRNLSNEKFNYW